MRFQSITEAIDTVTPTGRAMLHMVALLAELERGLITERTSAGVKAAKRRGLKFGDKPKLSPEQVDHAREQIERGKAAQEVAAFEGRARDLVARVEGMTVNRRGGRCGAIKCHGGRAVR